jgi:hypothetical protein
MAATMMEVVAVKKSRKRISRKPQMSPRRVAAFFESLFGEDLHAKRVISLSNAAVGVVTAGSLLISMIGRGLAVASGRSDKHSIKQVDRLLSNTGIVVWELFEQWVPFVVGQRREIRVNLDWTEFDSDDHSMIVLSLQTKHGRATPLIWMTVTKSELKGQRNDHEDEVLARLRGVLPEGVHVTIVADRGFSDQKLYAFLTEELGFDFVIRFRSNTQVTDEGGEIRTALEWLGKGGRMRVLRNPRVTQDLIPVATVVVVQNKGMKEPWCLVASNPDLTGAQIKKIYGKRFTCEESFRDIKDLRFGLGMKWTSVRNTDRRDRLMLIAVLAQALLTLLGEAGERAGLDRLLKANTSKKRSLSLFRQGLRWYELIPNMPEERLQILMEALVEVVREHSVFQGILGVV